MTETSGPSHAEELRDRFRATLLGCAIGDALGFPFEGAPPEAIARVSELADDFSPSPRGRFAKGQYTDDTQMTLALAASIAEEGRVDGRAIAQRYASLWREGIILAAGDATAGAIQRILAGTPWMSAGAEVGCADNGAAMRASPIGLWNWDEPTKIARDAELQGVITHKDPRSIAGGAAVAAAVALALHEGLPVAEIFCSFVAEAAGAASPEVGEAIREIPRLLKWETRPAVAHISRMGLEPGRVLDWPGISPFVIPSVAMAVWCFLREPDDFRAAVRLALLAGGDADTTGAMVGAISGARLGMAGLPARLRRGVLHADIIIEIADRLFARKMQPRERLPRVGALIRGVVAKAPR